MVFFISLGNETLTLDLDPTTTSLESLHFAIERESGVPASHQRLFFSSSGQLIGTDGTIPISRLGVGPNSTLTLRAAPDRSATAVGEFAGNDVGLFAGMEYDEENEAADAVWEEINKRIDSMWRDRREARLRQVIEKCRASSPNITEQKRKLFTMSTHEWDSVLENGDYLLRNKTRRFEGYVPVPDALLEKSRQEKEHVAALDPETWAAAGTETPWAQTPVTDLTPVGENRGSVLSLKLDGTSDSVAGLTVVDPRGYLTDLKSMKIDADISDIERARLLLKLVIQTNPNHPPGWIAAARLEELAGNIQAARQLITKGCEECPKNKDVWVEACRLSSPDEAKAVIARGVKAIPNSVGLWMQAAKLEHDNRNKSRVLRKGLKHIPDSVRLWKAVLELPNEEDARHEEHEEQ